MKVRGRGTVLVGEGGLESPPLPYIELDDAEAEVLIARGLALEYRVDPEAVQEPEQKSPAAPLEPATEPVASVVGDSDEDENEGPHGTVPETPEEDERLTAIVEHIEALTEDDFVRTGARAGRPKVKPLADALGWADLTVEEVDAAFAKREAGE